MTFDTRAIFSDPTFVGMLYHLDTPRPLPTAISKLVFWCDWTIPSNVLLEYLQWRTCEIFCSGQSKGNKTGLQRKFVAVALVKTA